LRGIVFEIYGFIANPGSEPKHENQGLFEVTKEQDHNKETGRNKAIAKSCEGCALHNSQA
jgi:hypothetical protein